MESLFVSGGIQMDLSLIISNQVVLCLKVSIRPNTNMRRILFSIACLPLQQMEMLNFNPLKPVILHLHFWNPSCRHLSISQCFLNHTLWNVKFQSNLAYLHPPATFDELVNMMFSPHGSMFSGDLIWLMI